MIAIDRTPWRPAIRALAEGDFVAAIGDVHGRADLLAALQDAIAEEIGAVAPRTATLVHLGDLVDRGPQSRRAVALARAGLPGVATVTLRGNHEERMLEELAGSAPLDPRWYAMGGRELFIECGVEPTAGWQGRLAAAFGADLVDWLRCRATMHRHGALVFVHAGIDPAVDLELQDPRTLAWVRESWWTHPGPYPQDVAVIHGHVPVASIDLDHPRRIALDTKAHATGVLSALVVAGARMRLVSTRVG